MKKKELYEAPSVETYDLEPQGNLLNNASPNGSDSGYDNDNDLGEIGNSSKGVGGLI